MKPFRFKRARRLRRYLGVARGTPLAGPQVVSLEITHHCNLGCSFCESHGRLQSAPITARRSYVSERTQMEVDTACRLARELAAEGTDLVELSGKGEPLLHPQVTDILEVLASVRLECALVTNGTPARSGLAADLVRLGLSRVSVSLNAGSRDVYRRSSSRDLWHKARGFLEDLMAERRRRSRSRPSVRITHVMTKENIDDLDGMVRVSAELGVDEVMFLVMGELPQTGFLQLDGRDRERIAREAPAWAVALERGGVAHNLPAFMQGLASRIDTGGRQDNPLQRSLACYQGWMFAVIAPDGVVTPCCYCEEEILGNINERSFRAIWRGAPYASYRRRCLEMPRTGRPICKECFTSCNVAAENRRIRDRVRWARKFLTIIAPSP